MPTMSPNICMNHFLPFHRSFFPAQPWFWTALVGANLWAQPTAVPPGASLPSWPKPDAPAIPKGSPFVKSRSLSLVHSPDIFGGFILHVAGQSMAIGWSQPHIGYVLEGELRWVDLASPSSAKLRVQPEISAIQVTLAALDQDGGRWQITQRFSPGPQPDTIRVSIEVGVDQVRN